MKCNLIDFDKVNWQRLDHFQDRTVFQTRDWLQFLAETQHATPIVAELTDGGTTAGYFSGLTFKRFGLRILGSSFPGWTTPYIGFNLLPGFSRSAALAAIEEAAFGALKCMHLEVSDPYLSEEDGRSSGFELEYYASYRTDLTRSEEQIFNSMESACRRCIRKAEKSGVIIEEAHDSAFADEYYRQLGDVFARQGLVPTYGLERVRAVIRNLHPAGRLLLLRARDPQGRCIATGIFPGFNKIAEFWGNASVRTAQILRPNEAIHWYAMRYWRNRGVEIYDWGGEGKYKEKYGCTPHRVPWFSKSRHKLVWKLRNEAKKAFERKQRALGWLRAKPQSDLGTNES
ncbi:MAG TPA: GNAT family N-acetyltransferase [Terriglobia bacterium]|nr:GNAT family N-acetyltransferase [Terriglobia bacterium]